MATVTNPGDFTWKPCLKSITSPSRHTSPSPATIISLSAGCGQWPHLRVSLLPLQTPCPESISRWETLQWIKLRSDPSHDFIAQSLSMAHCLRRSPDSCLWMTRSLESWSLPPPPASSCSFLLPLPQHPPSASPLPRMHPALGLCMCWSPSRANASVLHPALAPSGRAYDHSTTYFVQSLGFLQSLFQPIFIEHYFFWGSRDTT